MTGLIYSRDSIFNQNVQTIVNTVNCVGVMGAGIALECRLRYPEMFEDYIYRCQRKEVGIGKPYLYPYENLWILNFPTKLHWINKSKLEWIEEGLKYFRDNYKSGGIKSIAFPKLGCDRGGLDWEEVNNLMREYLENLDIDVYICLDELEEPKGIEKNMTDSLNNLSIEDLTTKLKIRKTIALKIINNSPFEKFRQLLFINGIGVKTYEKLFRQIYGEVTSDSKMHNNTKKYKQTKLV